MLSAWRAALRIGRREIWRSKGRSAVVVAMVGVPVLLITALIVLFRTLTPTEAETALRSIGNADALITAESRTPMAQDPEALVSMPNDDQVSPDDQTSTSRPWTAAEVAQTSGGRVFPLLTGSTLVDSDRGALSASVREFDIREPIIGDLARLTDGRAPENTDEILVSDALVEQGYRPGTTLRLDTEQARTLDIVGVVRNPTALDEAGLVGLPGAVLGEREARPEYLVDTDGKPVSWSKVKQLNDLGLVVQSRSVLLDPPPRDQQYQNIITGSGAGAAMFMFYSLVVLCIVLEVVLLAGPAFAVGARRQTRQFALLSATGGTPKDIRRVLLGQGLVLGLGSALAGSALAIAALLAGRPLIESFVGSELGALDVRPLDLALILGVGTFAAFAASYVPARQASHQHTVAALAGRPGPLRTRKGWPILGLMLLGAGLLLSAYGVTSRSGGEIVVVIGTLVVVAAAIIVTPGLLGLVGRLGRRMPLALRLASRDTARHRSRNASAVAAVMGTVIGVTALGIGSSSDFAENRRDYEPGATMGTMTITPAWESEPDQSDAEGLAARIEQTLPGRTADIAYGSDMWGGAVLLVATADDVDGLMRGKLTADERQVLESGGALVARERTLDSDGQTTVGPKGDRTELPGVYVPELTIRHDGWNDRIATAVISPRTAERLEIAMKPTSLYVPPREPAITEQQQATVDELAAGTFGLYTEVYVERGFVESYTPILLILAGIGGLIVFVGTSTATALALDDARPDFATLGAIGASPGVRRRQAMAQAAVIGLLGAVLGVVVGAVPGIAITYPLTAQFGQHILDIPWTLLGFVVLAVPLLAVAGAGLFTRSRLPMVHRIN